MPDRDNQRSDLHSQMTGGNVPGMKIANSDQYKHDHYNWYAEGQQA